MTAIAIVKERVEVFDHAVVHNTVTTGPQLNAGRRDRAVDLLRGWCIVMMITTHLASNSFLQRLVHAPKFISGAGGFVFISGFTLGMVSRRRIARNGLAAANVKMLRRAGTIWLVHLVLCTIFVAIAQAWPRVDPGQVGNVSAYGGWVRTLVLIATLRLQPQFMDVLPLYVIFIAVSPLVLALLNRGHVRWVVALSLAVWAMGQWKPGLLDVADSRYSGITFRVVGWQAIFFLPMCLGYCRKEIKEWLARGHKAITLSVCALIFGTILFIARAPLAHLGHHLPGWVETVYFDRYVVRAGGLLYLFAAAPLAYCVARSILAHPFWSGGAAWLEIMGRRGLYCYLIHFAVMILLTAAGGYAISARHQDLVAVGFLVAICYMAKYRVLGRLIPN